MFGEQSENVVMKSSHPIINNNHSQYHSISSCVHMFLVKRETHVLPDNFMQLYQYIEEVIFNGEPGVLTKDDVSMLLLSELGTSYTHRTPLIAHLLGRLWCKSENVSIIIRLLIFI